MEKNIEKLPLSYDFDNLLFTNIFHKDKINITVYFYLIQQILTWQKGPEKT